MAKLTGKQKAAIIKAKLVTLFQELNEEGVIVVKESEEIVSLVETAYGMIQLVILLKGK